MINWPKIIFGMILLMVFTTLAGIAAGPLRSLGTVPPPNNATSQSSASS